MQTEVVEDVADPITMTVLEFLMGKTSVLTINELNLALRISGPTWDGLVDSRVAALITRLNADFYQVLRSIRKDLDSNVDWENVISAHVLQGSTEIVFQHSKAILTALGKMRVSAQIVLYAAILSVIGLLNAKGIIEALSKNESERISSDERKYMVEAIQKIATQAMSRDSSFTPIFYPANIKDSLMLPAGTSGKASMIVAQEFRSESQAQGSSSCTYLDGEFELVSIAFSGDVMEVYLRHGRNEIVADVLMQDADQRPLEECARKERGQRLMNFQLCAVFEPRSGKGSNYRFHVVGFGEPRRLSTPPSVFFSE